jgi:hypothetical protein
MSTGETRPRPRPKTVSQWRDVRRERCRSAGGKSGFRVLPTKVVDSDAFNELSKSAKIVLMLSLCQLDYWIKKKHKYVPKRDSSIGPLRNDGCFSLPSTLLKERGIKSSETIAEVRKEIVAAGFWETLETGSLYNTAVLRWSDKWLLYNQQPLAQRKQLDKNAKQPGYCHCPNIVQHNEANRINKAGGSSFTDQQGSITNPQEEDHPLQLELFPELAA